MAEYYILDAEQCDDWISFSVPARNYTIFRW